ncbi:hypothetical protein Hanom_Chr12g01121141 [Helianthus anomalus]
MASSTDAWVREYNEASKLSDGISNMILAMSSYGSGPKAQRHSSDIRRKFTILGTRLDSLQSLTGGGTCLFSMRLLYINGESEISADTFVSCGI